ncbi:MAG: hypothetical protein HYV34_01425 [Candidatus Kerfeldbacteria bacterium]|nr:hypothetical protein [Candidatus Kerfeldbacteria bacterium]
MNTTDKIREIHRNPNFLRWWQKVILFVVFVSLIVFIASLFIDIPPGWSTATHVFDLVAAILLGIDLLFEYLQAKTKKDFLRNHWFEILAMLPWGRAVSEGARAIRVTTAVRAIEATSHAHRITAPLPVVPEKIEVKNSIKRKSNRKNRKRTGSST